jgi:P63C domain
MLFSAIVNAYHKESIMAKKKKLTEHAKAMSAAGASKGGLARSKNLSVEEKSAIAVRAAKARWHGGLPNAAHGDADHPLQIGEIEIPCYVLDNGMRVITHRGLQKSLDMAVSGGARDTALYMERLASKALQVHDLSARLSHPVEFVPQRGGRSAFGYEATVLADLCDAILDARKNGSLRGGMATRIADRCELLLRGFARVGIIALIDEATGYQDYRDKSELHKILEAYIAKELLPWTKRFPPEFYQEMFRLRGWKNPESIQKPRLVGYLTDRLVYKKLPDGVLEELQQKNPKDARGRRKHKHHQFLTKEVGNTHLERHLAVVTALMRASSTWEQFKDLLNRAVPPSDNGQDMIVSEGCEDVDVD